MGLLLKLLVVFTCFWCGSISEARQPILRKLNSVTLFPINKLQGVRLPVQGDVHTKGFFWTTIKVGSGNQILSFKVQIDTGSHISWVQCANCKGCDLDPSRRYNPSNHYMKCPNPICRIVGGKCPSPQGHCTFKVKYADKTSVKGSLVRDQIHLKLSDSSDIQPVLAFGCAEEIEFGRNTPHTGGLLGLSNNEASFVKQLIDQGKIQGNVIGYCLSSVEDQLGYLLIGQDPAMTSGFTWTKIITIPGQHGYTTGPASLYFGPGREAQNLNLIFDSGTSFTYLNHQVFQQVSNWIMHNIEQGHYPLKLVKHGNFLCWRATNGPPFETNRDGRINNYFRPFELFFGQDRLLLPPANYLFISKSKNVCLGFLDGGQVGLGDMNIIGDISMLDKLVVYDNDRGMIGWKDEQCRY